MADKNMTCAGCRKDFIFTENDQEFYSKQIDKKTGQPWTPPKRCKDCRELAKKEKFGRSY